MKAAAKALAAAALLAWAGAAAAQAETKPAPQPAARDEAPRINLKLDDASLRQLSPAIDAATPPRGQPAGSPLPELGGAPAAPPPSGRNRPFDSGGGPFPKDMNPNLR